jgi:hypothetical protein
MGKCSDRGKTESCANKPHQRAQIKVAEKPTLDQDTTVAAGASDLELKEYIREHAILK